MRQPGRDCGQARASRRAWIINPGDDNNARVVIERRGPVLIEARDEPAFQAALGPAAVQAIALDRIADGVFFTRDLVSEPPNVIHPESLAEETKKLASLGVDVELLNEKQMKKLGIVDARSTPRTWSGNESQCRASISSTCLLISRWSPASTSGRRRPSHAEENAIAISPVPKRSGAMKNAS